MKRVEIPSNEGNGSYIIRWSDDFEHVNPIYYMRTEAIQLFYSMTMDILTPKNFPFPDKLKKQVVLKSSIKDWDEKYKEIKSAVIPEGLLKILENTSKKDQEKKLKGVSLTEYQLVAFIFYAWEKYGYTYSQYKAEHFPNGFDKTDLPRIVHLNDEGKVDKAGQTTLSDGKLKQLVNHRKATVAKFLDLGDVWHCLFITYNSLGGEESYKEGQPHYHYISSSWGLSREYVVEQLKSKNYSLPTLPHIDLISSNYPKRVLK